MLFSVMDSERMVSNQYWTIWHHLFAFKLHLQSTKARFERGTTVTELSILISPAWVGLDDGNNTPISVVTSRVTIKG